MRSYQEFKKKLLKDKEIKTQYEALAPEFAVIKALIRKRLETGVTQATLAKKMGTQQSAISRLEAGRVSPTISFLQKLAVALGTRLEFSFR